MRLIGSLKGKSQAYQFYSFLKKEKIECTYEHDSLEEETFQFWVMHEEEINAAAHWLKEFQNNPEDSRFDVKDHPIDTQGIAAHTSKKNPFRSRAFYIKSKIDTRMPITRLIVLICAFFYLWNNYQINRLNEEDQELKEEVLTPLIKNLSYELPTQANEKELSASENQEGGKFVWDGFYGIALRWPESKKELDASMFVQIRKGEVWRLFTPVLLHGSFLHVLFNMLWLWMLGKQIEQRTKKWQYLSITLIIGVCSNTFQYLMSGPLFIGYSGIVCGLAGFIWMRQKRAPWEGYPLERGTIAFLAVFILGMMLLQFVSFFLVRYQIADFPMNIANTAHISGAIMGILLGRISFLSKGNL